MTRSTKQAATSTFTVLFTSALLTAAGLGLGSSAFADAAGLYTAEQAQSGELLFNNNCAECHRPDLTGAMGPALKGQAFLQKWDNKPLGDLYAFEHSQMPANHPGALSDDQMMPITAFILSKNGYPAGQVALTKDSLTQMLAAPSAQ